MPSPGTAIGFVALLVALSGTAIALPGRNTVDSGDIRKGGVKTADLRRNAVTGPKVRNGTLRGADVRNDSLTGADLDERTLGQVPSANTANSSLTANSATTAGSADSADSVDGLSFARIFYRAEYGSPPSQILTLNGLTLSASCAVAGPLALSATTAVSGAMLHWAVIQNQNPVDNDADGQANVSDDNYSIYGEEDFFNPGTPVAIADDGPSGSGAPDSAQGTLTYARPDGGIVTATFTTEEEEDILGGTDDCFVIGHAQSSS